MKIRKDGAICEIHRCERMSDEGWRPGDGGGPAFGMEAAATGSSSRSVPIYVLFLIMLGSGICTLVILWVCVHCIYQKRRARRARADVERNAAAAAAHHQEPWGAAGAAVPTTRDGHEAADMKRCCDDGGDVELTYVVMAGEEQPTFLARPVKTSLDSSASVTPSSPTALAAPVPSIPAKTSAS